MNKADKLALILQEMLKTYMDKNTDYGDSFSKSYQEFGLTAPVVRISDKVERLKSLTKADAMVKDESIRDTFIDCANYCVMAVLEMDIEDEKNKASEKELKDVVNARTNNWTKTINKSLNEIAEDLDRINGVGIEDKDTLPLNRPYDHLFDMYVDEHEDYTEGDKLNI